jgi:glutamate/tyrosine decarboxylase-like PLP-dependent enzyme
MEDMELWTVPLFGAVIGVAFNLLSFVWEPVRLVGDLCHIKPLWILVLGAVGGASAITVQFALALFLFGY